MTWNDKDPGEGRVNEDATTYDVNLSWIARIFRWWKRNR